ncbi:nuclear transport factor 2 family protein [Kribbella sp. CA-293567]|uniref:nuclear transport factor 2 family protein n=1 Tax=Kribbella sp. CA-293567 TaxID=3002436 RepID=UPI0022DD56F1|nr:nuclear transport factor 2 family protein [Kribbella sp. CA-293567]WBQ04746.1 nuclear transport factor 2 family protein [Kribbella sp. CA-293567]
MNTTSTLTSLLDQWKTGIAAHDSAAVAKLFTDDAIFQGLRPYTIGPVGVAEYYESQPLGLTADYDLLETRQLSDDLVLGYLEVAFSFVDRPTVEVFLSIVARRNDTGWKLDHYQVSKLA